jgi:glycine betaine/proline transport system substrate-binding protein
MEAWRPNQDSFIAKYVDEKKVAEIVATSYSNAPQGFVVPKYVIEGDAERGIAPMIDPADIIEVNGVKTFSVDKLNNYKSLFNIDADANGELIGGPAGWIATDINDWKIASYGLEYDQTIQDEWVAWALFTAAIEKGEPIVGYMYAPTSIMFKFDFVWLQEPEYTAEKWADFETWKAADRPTQATAEWQPGKACAYPGADVVVIVTDELKDQAPEVYDFLKNWSIPLEDVTELAAKIELDKLPAGKVAADWVEANRAKVDAMLGK